MGGCTASGPPALPSRTGACGRTCAPCSSGLAAEVIIAQAGMEVPSRTVVVTSHGPLYPRSTPSYSKYVLDHEHKQELARSVELAALSSGTAPPAPSSSTIFSGFGGLGHPSSSERRGWRPSTGSRSRATGAYGTPTTAAGFMPMPQAHLRPYIKTSSDHSQRSAASQQSQPPQQPLQQQAHLRYEAPPPRPATPEVSFAFNDRGEEKQRPQPRQASASTASAPLSCRNAIGPPPQAPLTVAPPQPLMLLPGRRTRPPARAL